jgi:hypothetical protein
MADGYWRRVHLRAHADAGKELHIESRGRVVIALLGAIGAIVALAFLGSSDASRDEIIARGAIGGIVILLFPFVYLWKFLGTPGRLEQELESKLSARLDEQTGQIADLRDQMKPCIKLSYAADGKTRNLGGGSKATYLYATNERGRDVTSAQVKIEEAKFKPSESGEWQNTSIIARTNMSWGDKPDGDPQKYSTVQLAPGSEIIDFISGPHKFLQQNRTQIGFLVRIDPKHWQNVSPVFSEIGTYKFVMQASASDVEKPARLTLFVNWDGKNLVILSDTGQVLESAAVLEA